MTLLHAGRWHASVTVAGVRVGVSRVSTMSGQPQGWVSYVDAPRLNRRWSLRLEGQAGRYHW